MKKRFIFFAALAVFLAIAVTPANAAKPLKIVKGPYLQQVTPHSIVIMWETNTAADSRVDYDGQFVEDSTPVKIHEIELTGLAADTAYYYTVTSGTKTSPTSTFATAPAAPRSFRFVAYGDTRTNANAHAAVIQGIINSAPEIVLHTGDLVENGDDSGQWGRQFFGPAHDLMINTPLLPIIGNHEGSGNLFRDLFSLGNNDYWFAFTYGGVRFIGLNTHNVIYSPGSTQYTWLEEELQSPECTSADWQIVYFHHPPYTATSGHSDDMNVQTYLVPLFEQYGVDMVFNGHSHAYERYFHNGIYYIVTGGGGAPLAGLVTDTKEPIREFGESVYHHCVIDVSVEAKTLTLYACYNDGTLLHDPITIEEPVDVTPPTASLLVPLDNGADDLDADDGEVTVNTTQSIFQIQLSDVGDGIDDATVIPETVTLTKDGGAVGYTFGYDTGLDVITLTSAGSDFDNGIYAITLSGIADLADPANVMAATTLSILIDTSIVPPVTLSFQQGVGGYIGTKDTMIRSADPTTNFATYFQSGYPYQYNADTDSSGGPSQVLLRFDNIIGSSQIPSGSAIISATLRIRSTDDGNGGKLHRILQTWVDTDVTWNNSFGGNGIQADGISEAASLEDDGVPSNFPDTDVDLDVTATVQAWADGVTNNGWAILPNGTNGWHIAAAEYPAPDEGYRPELIVTFLTTGNRPPVADAGSDQTVSDADGTEAEIVTLDGSGSYDPDGTISTYEWTEGAAILGTSDIITYDFAVGTHTVTLTVTDNEGATASDDVVITVNANQAPTADAGPDETVTDTDENGSESVTLTGSGSDADGTIASYEWKEGETHVGTGASITANFSVGVHTVTLTVTDNGGATASDDVVITVNPAGATMHVQSIAMSLEQVGKKWQATAKVTISPAQSEALVVGDWYFKGVLRLSGDTGVTDADGIAVLTSFTTPAKTGQIFTFTVTDVVASGYTYDDSLNVETSDSITVP